MPLSALLVLVPVLAAAAPLASVRLEGVPHVRQRPDFCGEACAEMWLKKLGQEATQDDVFALTGLDPSLGRGAWTNELAKALRAMGFEVGPVWYAIDPRQGERAVEAQFAALHADLRRGIPSIVCGHYSDEPGTTEHFRLVLGYDGARDEVLYHEPAEADGAYRRMKRELFLKLWTFKPRSDRWTLIRMRLDGREISSRRDAARPSVADYAQRVVSLKERTRGRGFTIVVEPPFVVVGNESPETVRQRGAGTVRWTVERLRRDFLPKDPEEIIDVWAFRDEPSYLRGAWEFFGDRPSTPYGYYSARDQALIMNIGPGYGTLVHEIVHPYMRANAPAAPPWLNEGLASLFERPAEERGRIIGYVNWRLPALQRDLRKGRIPSIRALTAMDEAKFYDDDQDHYAQARYLCLYLQERGLLREYVRRWLAVQDVDPTGYATLQEVLGRPDMAAFERRWAAYVLALDPKVARAPKPRD